LLRKTPEKPNESSVSDLTSEEKEFLLELARFSIECAVNGEQNSLLKKKMPERFQQKAAVFVTLTKEDELRGCIGSIVPQDMLFRAVASSAVNAALHDPRFNPVKETDLQDLSYEISVLSRFKLVVDIEEIQVGRHGLLIQSESNRGLLLPR